MYCIDCGKIILDMSKRCKACSKKGNLNPRFNKKPSNYKGGTITKSGSRNIIYKEVRINKKRLKEHRYIMEKELGRKLRKDEIIHHKDGNGLNNRLDNLQIVNQSEHRRLHYGNTGG